MKFKPPPAGENTITSLGHPIAPKQHLRSGLSADRGHAQNGFEARDVIMATPSIGFDKKPLCGRSGIDTIEHGEDMAMRRMLTILSNGTSISTLPIQNLSPPSDVISTHRTELYQNQATADIFAIDTVSTVP
mmetsp:Transcript_6759/g.8390  ORF Transcript_6759/g.8390 Transcript_6759/m.8390 type:complete len:132 (-) Transcript_6759:335-730(-)